MPGMTNTEHMEDQFHKDRVAVDTQLEKGIRVIKRARIVAAKAADTCLPASEEGDTFAQ